MSIAERWRKLGVYRSLPFFFVCGAAVEWFMINVRVGKETFCKMMQPYAYRTRSINACPACMWKCIYPCTSFCVPSKDLFSIQTSQFSIPAHLPLWYGYIW